MQVIVHRGTHQIGGMATEISTESTRIIIDMGDELSLEENFIPTQLHIPGVTDLDGKCDAVLFTHYHGDHIGQLKSIRDGIPLYMGSLAKDILLATTMRNDKKIKYRVEKAKIYEPGKAFMIGDIIITPFSIDHSACDSYMFLIEADGKKILYTGDFRVHGFRGKGIPKILDKLVRKVDILITEGTTLTRTNEKNMTERELQQKVKQYMEKYKYVFVLCATTNLERICALSKVVSSEKYFICDKYQDKLIELITKNWGEYSPLYRSIRRKTYNKELMCELKDKGFLMMVRDNQMFRKIITQFNQEQSLILYSMWDGYRTKPGSKIPDFLNLAGKWEYLHTSGHASKDDLKMVVDKVNPEVIIPIHADKPGLLKTLCPNKNVVVLEDGEVFNV